MEEYLQTTEYTCGSAALLMVLKHFDKMQSNRENEFKIWMESALLPVRASSIYGLALYAKKLGLNPEIYVETKDYEYPNYRFKSYKLKDVNQAKFSSNLFLKEAEKNNIKIYEKNINLEDIKNFLKNNKILIARMNVGVIREHKAQSNYVVIYGYGDKKFLVIDPKSGKKVIPEEQFKEAFETVKTKCKRDNRAIVF
ncbi:MAG: peptidase C39 family protein [Candidatus Nanoarchaeia archaeon]|nr:peptidase C39 family protein [Candidatus Nanoarchaeia archaeon]